MKHSLILATLCTTSMLLSSSSEEIKSNLFAACENNDWESLEEQTNGYNIEPLTLRKNGKTLLHVAAQHNAKRVCRKLIKEYNFSPTTKTSSGKNTPLHVAAHRGNLAAVKTILHYKGFNTDKNLQGKTPIERALLKGHIDVANVILDYGEKYDLSNDLIIKESTIDKILDKAVEKRIAMPSDTIYRVSKTSHY